MTTPTPDFDELVGSDLEPSERDRLRRVHDLLVAAGPPPELSTQLGAAPTRAAVRILPRRWLRPIAVAAAVGVLVFAVGYVAGGGSDYETFDTVTMTGTGALAGAHATIEVFDADAAGNWPMEISITGLAPPASGRPYEVWLTRGGELAGRCGSFLADADGTTTVPMNAPYKLRDFDGWVVVEEGSSKVLLTT